MDKNTENIIDVVTVDEKKNKTKKTIIKVWKLLNKLTNIIWVMTWIV